MSEDDIKEQATCVVFAEPTYAKIIICDGLKRYRVLPIYGGNMSHGMRPSCPRESRVTLDNLSSQPSEFEDDRLIKVTPQMPARGRGGGRRRQRGRGGRNQGSQREGGQGAANGQMATSMNFGMVVKTKPLFAYRTRRRLQYFASSTLLTGTATANAYVFSANGLFDPDVTGTGGQPMGFDQMMAFYNHYTVLKSKITVLCVNQTALLTPSVGISVQGSTSVTSSIEQLIENGDIVFHSLLPAGVMGSQAKLTRGVSMKWFQGINQPLDDPNMRGDGSSNPTEQTYFQIVAYNPFSATQATIGFQALIEFDVIFQEPRIGTLSLSNKRVVPEEEKKTIDPEFTLVDDFVEPYMSPEETAVFGNEQNMRRAMERMSLRQPRGHCTGNGPQQAVRAPNHPF